MWTRKELKTKAKASLKRNYWKTVLIALVFTIVCSGAGTFGAASGSGSRAGFTYNETPSTITGELTGPEADEMIERLEEIDNTDIDNPPIDEINHTFELYRGGEDGEHIVGEIFGRPIDIPVSMLFAISGVLFVIFLVVLAVAMTVSAFLANPVEVGTARFFIQNLNQPAEIKEVTFGFDHNYLQTVKTLFFRDLRILLWGLLFIIPGVVKAYEYRMMPYLLADDPTMSTKEAFAQSKRMMSGNKWRAFVLDLSFILWYLLAIPTVGLITIFFANPYKKMTDAALYEALRYGNGQAAPQDYAPLPVPTPVATTSTSASASVPVPVHPFAALDAPAPTWDDATTEDEPAGAGPTGPVVPKDPQA